MQFIWCKSMKFLIWTLQAFITGNKVILFYLTAKSKSIVHVLKIKMYKNSGQCKQTWSKPEYIAQLIFTCRNFNLWNCLFHHFIQEIKIKCFVLNPFKLKSCGFFFLTWNVKICVGLSHEYHDKCSYKNGIVPSLVYE